MHHFIYGTLIYFTVDFTHLCYAIPGMLWQYCNPFYRYANKALLTLRHKEKSVREMCHILHNDFWDMTSISRSTLKHLKGGNKSTHSLLSRQVEEHHVMITTNKITSLHYKRADIIQAKESKTRRRRKKKHPQNSSQSVLINSEAWKLFSHTGFGM